MKKIIILFIFFLSFLVILYSKEKIQKQKIYIAKSIPQNEKDNLFNIIPPSITIDSFGNFYFPFNFKHKIFKFNQNGKLILTIGRKGSGPGDLYLPYKAKIYNDRLFVLDNNAFSIFTLAGKFVKRFRYFAGIEDFIVKNNKIYANYSIGKNIISVFNFSGKKLFSFADLNKINNIDYKKYKEVKPLNFTDLTISRIDSSSNNIYLLFPQFGVLCKYNIINGVLVKKKILKFYDEHIDKSLEKIRKLLLSGKYRSPRVEYGMKNKGTDVFLLSSIRYCNKKLFISVSSNFTNLNEMIIFQLDTKTLKVEKEYILYKSNSNLSDNFLVRYKNKSYDFYIFYNNYETGLIKMGIFKANIGRKK